MRVAVLYIATGKYFIFWNNFYESAKRNLFYGVEKKLDFFLFTDQTTNVDGSDTCLIPMENEPWPLPTLKRYHYFLKIEDKLKEYDYIYFFNANSIIINPVNQEILPKGNADFSFVQQPYTLSQTNLQFGYERRKESKAFIDYGVGKYYIWGAFNGGRANAFLKMAHIIKEWADEDLKQGIVAAFWDESFLNRYLLELNDTQYTLVSTDLFFVDGFTKDTEYITGKCIQVLEKSKFFDTSFKHELSFREKVTNKIKSFKKILSSRS